MTIPRTPDSEPVTGSIAVAEDPAEVCPTCTSPDPKLHPAVQFEGEVQPCADPWHAAERTAGEQLLAELAEDEPPIEPTDKPLHALGCLVSALALHIPPGHWSSVALLRPPGEHGAQIEVRCGTTTASQAVVDALPWPHPPVTRVEDGVTDRHHVTRGVLWGFRVAVVGLEPLGGAA